MRAALAPRVHLFVCANRREPGAPLGTGCAERGEAVYDALKREVDRRGRVTDVWVTKTHCLGVCPARGSTIARYPSGSDAVLAEVEPTDAAALLEQAEAEDPPLPYSAIERELEAACALQASKVLGLARRLRPGLTAEDVQNPHDFPELDDPDWHYADGVLTGMQSIASTLRALRRQGGR